MPATKLLVEVWLSLKFVWASRTYERNTRKKEICYVAYYLLQMNIRILFLYALLLLLLASY